MTEGDLDTDVREKAAGRGCLFGGCTAVVIILLVLGGILGFSVYRVYTAIEEFASPGPAELGIRETSDEEYEEVRKEIEALGDLAVVPADGAARNDEAETITISPDDLNSLIAKSPEARSEKLPGRVRVRGGGDRMLVDLSWPLEEFPGLSGRYFNVTLVARMNLEHGEVTIDIEKGTTPQGKELPETILDMFSDDLTGKANQYYGGVLENVDNLEIRKGEIHIEPRRSP